MMNDHLSEGSKHFLDALSVATLLGSIANVLPSVAAILTIFWTLIRIWETKTVGKIIGRKDDV